MENSNISFRKKKQLVEPGDVNVANLKTDDILVLYESNGIEYFEKFTDCSQEDVLEIYENWNTTLRPQDSKRTIKYMYTVKQLIQLERI